MHTGFSNPAFEFIYSRSQKVGTLILDVSCWDSLYFALKLEHGFRRIRARIPYNLP